MIFFVLMTLFSLFLVSFHPYSFSSHSLTYSFSTRDLDSTGGRSESEDSHSSPLAIIVFYHAFLYISAVLFSIHAFPQHCLCAAIPICVTQKFEDMLLSGERLETYSLLHFIEKYIPIYSGCHWHWHLIHRLMFSQPTLRFVVYISVIKEGTHNYRRRMALENLGLFLLKSKVVISRIFKIN